MENPQNPKETQTEAQKAMEKWNLVGFAWELGYIIALPIVLLGLAGKWADKHFHHEVQWLTLVGILIAIVLTTIWLTKRLKKYIKK